MLYYASKTKKVGSPVLTFSESKEVEYRNHRAGYARFRLRVLLASAFFVV